MAACELQRNDDALLDNDAEAMRWAYNTVYKWKWTDQNTQLHAIERGWMLWRIRGVAGCIQAAKGPYMHAIGWKSCLICLCEHFSGCVNGNLSICEYNREKSGMQRYYLMLPPCHCIAKIHKKIKGISVMVIQYMKVEVLVPTWDDELHFSEDLVGQKRYTP